MWAIRSRRHAASSQANTGGNRDVRSDSICRTAVEWAGVLGPARGSFMADGGGGLVDLLQGNREKVLDTALCERYSTTTNKRGGKQMGKWHEYRYEIADTTHDEDGNKMVEVTLYLKSERDKWDVLSDLSDYLEEGLK